MGVDLAMFCDVKITVVQNLKEILNLLTNALVHCVELFNINWDLYDEVDPLFVISDAFSPILLILILIF